MSSRAFSLSDLAERVLSARGNLLLGILLCHAPLLTLPSPAQGQSISPPSVQGTFHIVGGDVVLLNGDVLEGADVLIRDGRIAAVGLGLAPPGDAVRIEAVGSRVYPGLIDSQTGIGLTEMTPEANDRSELGSYTPHLRTLPSVNAHSQGIPLARSNGITTAITHPTGGVIPGPAALIQMDGWTWEEMALRPEAAMFVNYPRVSDASGRGGSEEGQFDNAVAELREFLQDAAAYSETPVGARERNDLRLEAMRPVFSGEVPLMIQADGEHEIRNAMALTDEFGIRMILAGGLEAWKVAPLLSSRRIPVILGSILRTPSPDEPYDAVFAQPAILEEAGVKFALASQSTGSSRNLPYLAGMATAYGLSPAAAIKAITVWPAEIWGIGSELGSIEVGKRAHLFLADGDILDVRTSVLDVFIDGRRVSLDDRHRRLYENSLRRGTP